jgi:hypothetical protein
MMETSGGGQDAGNSTIERPADEIVEKIYAEVLEQLALPEAAATKLKTTETIERKWRMVELNAALLSNDTMQAIRKWGPSDDEFLRQVRESHRATDLPPVPVLRQE